MTEPEHQAAACFCHPDEPGRGSGRVDHQGTAGAVIVLAVGTLLLAGCSALLDAPPASLNPSGLSANFNPITGDRAGENGD